MPKGLIPCVSSSVSSWVVIAWLVNVASLLFTLSSRSCFGLDKALSATLISFSSVSFCRSNCSASFLWLVLNESNGTRFATISPSSWFTRSNSSIAVTGSAKSLGLAILFFSPDMYALFKVGSCIVFSNISKILGSRF